jgi:chemotaxis signal transduction protein
VGAARCAIRAGAVKRIVRSMTIYPLPVAATRLAGLGHFGGDPLVVFDLGAILDSGGSAGHHGGPTVVVEIGYGERAETVGLAVDEVLDVVPIEGHAVSPSGSGPVVGEILLGGEPVHVIDLEALADRV